MDNPEQLPSSKKESKGELFRFLGVASTVGINLVISTAIGFAIGYYVLDGYFFPKFLSLNTFPWFTLIFLLLGIATGFKFLFQIARKAGRNTDSDS